MATREAPINDFGLIIAYILPGLLALHGAGYLFPPIHQLMDPTKQQPSVAGFLLVTLASIGFGLLMSTVRWLVIDTLHHRTGVLPNTWDFSKLQQNIGAFDLLVSYQYRYYQFYGNGLVALVWWWIVRRVKLGVPIFTFNMIDLWVCIAAVLLFMGSRDTLTKYYQRKSRVLAGDHEDRASLMA
jgi:hypothetical protein